MILCFFNAHTPLTLILITRGGTRQRHIPIAVTYTAINRLFSTGSYVLKVKLCQTLSVLTNNNTMRLSSVLTPSLKPAINVAIKWSQSDWQLHAIFLIIQQINCDK